MSARMDFVFLMFSAWLFAESMRRKAFRMVQKRLLTHEKATFEVEFGWRDRIDQRIAGSDSGKARERYW